MKNSPQVKKAGVELQEYCKGILDKLDANQKAELDKANKVPVKLKAYKTDQREWWKYL